MFIIFYILFLLAPSPVYADTGHIVISEIQTYGQTATDEFFRLYNPTGVAIDISGWKLTKKTSSGAESNLVAKFSDGTTIAPNAYFLIAPQSGYLGTAAPDVRYSGASYSIADNNTVILKDASGAIIDKVGFGTATDFEGAPAPNPEKGASIKRVNNLDTDNNKNDFSGPAPAQTSNSTTQDNATAPSPPTISSAQYGDIVINEIVPNPADGKEWIELFNTTMNAVSLAGWKISDGASVIYEPEGQITGGGFFTAEINNRLNNSGDAIYLSDTGGKSIAQLLYGDWQGAAWPAPEKGQSLARDANGSYQISDTPTKNLPNQFTKSLTVVNNFASNAGASGTPVADYSFLSIVEILPNPKSNDTENEYIKIHNAADYDIDMGGLYLDDAEGGSRPWKIPAGTIVKAGDNLTFFRTISGLALNNDADATRILDKNKQELFAVEYENAPAGAIYIFKDRKWGWSNVEIKNQNNLITPPIPSYPKRGANSITAAVIAPPGIFGSQIMYVDGLQLYMYSHDWPELQIGDKIYAFGTPDIHDSEPRLKIKNKSTIKIISHSAAPEPATVDGLSEDDLGRLIIIEGEVAQAANTKIIINANGEEIPVYDKTKQKLFSHLKENDQAQITGIVSRYKDELRLLPRGEDDIKILKSAMPAVDKKPPIWQYLASTLTIGAFAGAVYIRRRKNGNSSNSTAQTLG